MNQLKNVYIFFSLSLLFIFAGCSFFLLNSQLIGTQKLEDKIAQDSKLYTPIAYLTQKIHSYDSQGQVTTESIDGIQCLVLSDDQTKTYIYQKEDSLQELYVLSTSTVNLNSGQKLMPCDSFNVHIEDNVVKMKVQDQSFEVSLRSGDLYA